MSSVKLKSLDSNKVKSYDIEVALKLLKARPKLYKLEDEKFELDHKGELKRRANKGTDKKSSQ